MQKQFCRLEGKRQIYNSEHFPVKLNSAATYFDGKSYCWDPATLRHSDLNHNGPGMILLPGTARSHFTPLPKKGTY